MRSCAKMLLNWLREAFFPKKCLVCYREGNWFCDDHFFFPENLEVRNFPFSSIEKIYAYTYYEHTHSQRLIKHLKFRGFWELAEICAEVMSKKYGNVLSRSVLVPVPLSFTRRMHRGFNQSALIAQSLQQKLPGIEVCLDLKRIRTTAPQATLQKKNRAKNIEGAFLWKGKTPPQKIILIDDVWTTGHTLEAAAKALKKAGCQHIEAVTFAHG